MTRKVLMVEDEKMISHFLLLELEHEGYEVHIARDGASALEHIQQEAFDVILTDLMLQDMSGLDFCLQARKTSGVPIVMLAVKAGIFELSSLMKGMASYIKKDPLLKNLDAGKVPGYSDSTPGKTALASHSVLTAGNVTMDVRSRDVMCNGKSVDLSKKEFDLLKMLLQNKNVVLTREKISEQLWGRKYTGDTNVIDVTIKKIRNKLDDTDNNFKNSLIQTVRGVGYVVKEMKQSVL